MANISKFQKRGNVRKVGNGISRIKSALYNDSKYVPVKTKKDEEIMNGEDAISLLVAANLAPSIKNIEVLVDEQIADLRKQMNTLALIAKEKKQACLFTIYCNKDVFDRLFISQNIEFGSIDNTFEKIVYSPTRRNGENKLFVKYLADNERHIIINSINKRGERSNKNVKSKS